MRHAFAIALFALLIGGCTTAPSRSVSERISDAYRIENVPNRDAALGKLAVEAAETRALDLTLRALNGISDDFLHDRTAMACIERFGATSDYGSQAQIAAELRSTQRRDTEVNRILARQAEAH